VHVEEFVWIVDTVVAPAVWRDRLKNVTDKATYFVIRLEKPWAAFSLNQNVADWLKSDERSW